MRLGKLVGLAGLVAAAFGASVPKPSNTDLELPIVDLGYSVHQAQLNVSYQRLYLCFVSFYAYATSFHTHDSHWFLSHLLTSP